MGILGGYPYCGGPGGGSGGGYGASLITLYMGPDDIEGATERFQQLVAAYALIQGYHQVLGDACKDLNFDVNNITYDKVEQWRNLHKNILSKSTKECDGKTFRVRKSFRIVLRHTYYSNQTSLRRLRRFLDDDRHKTIRKEKPTPKVPVTHNNSS